MLCCRRASLSTLALARPFIKSFSSGVRNVTVVDRKESALQVLDKVETHLLFMTSSCMR